MRQCLLTPRASNSVLCSMTCAVKDGFNSVSESQCGTTLTETLVFCMQSLLQDRKGCINQSKQSLFDWC